MVVYTMCLEDTVNKAGCALITPMAFCCLLPSGAQVAPEHVVPLPLCVSVVAGGDSDNSCLDRWAHT